MDAILAMSLSLTLQRLEQVQKLKLENAAMRAVLVMAGHEEFLLSRRPLRQVISITPRPTALVTPRVSAVLPPDHVPSHYIDAQIVEAVDSVGGNVRLAAEKLGLKYISLIVAIRSRKIRVNTTRKRRS